MRINDLTLQKLKKIEFDLLKAFIEVCNKLNLQYYVVYGTLLGAARHKGFIPWDDDIDVGMLRKDYEIFLEKGQALLPDYYFLQTRNTDPNYPIFFAKMRDSRTTFMASDITKINMNHGVYIDIFPLDYYPENKLKGKWIEFKKKVILVRRRSILMLDERSKGSIFKECSAKVLGLCARLFYPTMNSAYKAWEKLCTKTKESKLIVNNSGSCEKKEVVPIEWFNGVIKLEFEGIQVNAPIEYDKYLTRIYGNYMELPPIDKQVPHHYTKVIDLEKSYLEYIQSKKV